MASQRTIRIEPGYPLVHGANKISNSYNFTVEVPEDAEASLLLYHNKSKIPTQEILFTEEYRTGRVCSVSLSGFSPGEYEYNFIIDKKVFQDPCAYHIIGREEFGSPRTDDIHAVRCGFLSDKKYDWENDKAPSVPYEDLILYKVHVRGYTKQAKVRKKGTFTGLTEMIPYWKELGINAILLMPAYEFMEVLPAPAAEGLIRQKGDNGKINYWGYAPGYYFAPKQAYCATKDPEKEFRDLVKALHKEGMECIMEMYFPKETPPQLALRAVQFWKRYYHVDGFRFLGDGVPLELIFKDGLLSDTKLIASGFDYHSLYHDQKRVHRNLAECNYGFLQDMRRFLKSDEDVLQGVNYHIRHNPDAYSVINYMTDHDGFTLNDLVSYNYKHNEANGEDNADGSSYNYSWNCGIEGPSRRMTICQIRERQMKNAFLFMLLSQGVPMIYGGDEFGNSQNGNNNAYCQDNPIGWIDWKARRRNQKLWQFVKEAIAFRKAHPILHLSKELKGADYLAKGFPDISCHAERAWYLAYENTSRLIGIMYCGAYAKKADGRNDDLIYVGYNFHWEERTLALPNLPKGYTWKKIADTGESKTEDFFTQQEEKYERTVEIGPRTMIVLVGRKQED